MLLYLRFSSSRLKTKLVETTTSVAFSDSKFVFFIYTRGEDLYLAPRYISVPRYFSCFFPLTTHCNQSNGLVMRLLPIQSWYKYRQDAFSHLYMDRFQHHCYIVTSCDVSKLGMYSKALGKIVFLHMNVERSMCTQVYIHRIVHIPLFMTNGDV